MKLSPLFLCCLFIAFYVKAEWEGGYGAFREERMGKITKGIGSSSSGEFNIKQQWIELADERKFYWWWKAKYAMGASKRDKEIMQEYMNSYFIGGARSDNAPSWDEYLMQKAPPKNLESKEKKNNMSDKIENESAKNIPSGVFTENGDIPTETSVGRYQHKLYLAIGSRWNLNVQSILKQTKPGSVIIQFDIKPDGKIANITTVYGDSASKLAEVSANAIRLSSELIGPFPSDLIKEKPQGFTWKLAFRLH
jgi:hypothetical protein